MSKIKKLQPDPEAQGDHTTFIENLIGLIIKYATYIKNYLNPSGFDEIKRVDIIGGQHYDKKTGQLIDCPHVHEQTNGVRAATENEIPQRNKRKN